MAERYYKNPRELQIANTGIEVKVRRLSHGVKRDLRNFFSNYSLERETGMFEGIEIPTGAIEDLVVRRAIEDIKVSGNSIQFNSPSPIDDLPDIGMGDEEGSVDLYEEIIKTVVDSNRFLARLYPFNMVFAQYLALVNAEKRQYEEDKAKETGAKPDVNQRGDEVGPNPTESEQAQEQTEADSPTVKRLSGSEITATQG
jgi:hypothetical protein